MGLSGQPPDWTEPPDDGRLLQVPESEARYFSALQQLCDFRVGARAGSGSPPMKPLVERLSMDDMISLAAYTASLSP
jgi:cytochrome c553